MFSKEALQLRENVMATQRKKRVLVSQDGAFILRQLQVQQPAALLLVESVLTLDKLIGDGTTSAALLASSFIQTAYSKHVKANVSIQNILNGYDMALDYLVNTILPNAIVKDLILSNNDNQKVDDNDDNKNDRNDSNKLLRTVRSALSSKISIHLYSNYFANLITNAIQSVMRKEEKGKTMNSITINPLFDMKAIRFVSMIGGKSVLLESELLKSTVLLRLQAIGCLKQLLPRWLKDNNDSNDSGQLQSIHPYKIVLINDGIQRQRTKTKHYAMLETVEQLKNWKIDEEMVFKSQAERVRDVGADIVITKGNVHALVSHYLQEFNILCIPNVKREDLLFIGKTCNCKIAPSIGDLDESHVGLVESVELMEMYGTREPFTKIKAYTANDDKSTVNSTTCTVIIKGTTEEQCLEYIRHAQDALYTAFVMNENNERNEFVAGGGAFEIHLMDKLEELLFTNMRNSPEKDGVECFIEACNIIPKTLCQNAALSIEKTINDLKEKQRKEKRPHFGVPSSQIGDLDDFETIILNSDSENMNEQNDMVLFQIFDSAFTKRYVFETAVEIARTILTSTRLN
ncbi:hypothetical protein ABK040_003552 [Willaertia magna]